MTNRCKIINNLNGQLLLDKKKIFGDLFFPNAYLTKIIFITILLHNQTLDYKVWSSLQLIQVKNCPLKQEETIWPTCKSTSHSSTDYSNLEYEAEYTIILVDI